MRRILILMAALSVAPLCCSRYDSLKSRKITLILRTITDPVNARMAEGAQRAAGKMDLDLVILGLDQDTHVERQIALVEPEIIKHVGAIVISPADSKALVEVLKIAIKKGIVVINVDNPLDGALLEKEHVRTPFVGPDNLEGGRIAAKFLIEKLGGKGKVAVLEGVAGVFCGELRRDGFIETCKASNEILVVAQQTANWRRKDASEVFAKLMKEHPDIAGVFAVNADMALGALDAVKAEGKAGKIVIVAYDNPEEIQEAIRAGGIAGTIDEHPEKMGYAAIEVARKALAGRTVSDQTPTPIDLVTAESPERPSPKE